jgi:hypothetical protein
VWLRPDRVRSTLGLHVTAGPRTLKAAPREGLLGSSPATCDRFRYEGTVGITQLLL